MPPGERRRERRPRSVLVSLLLVISTAYALPTNLTQVGNGFRQSVSPMRRLAVLVVDDEKNIRETLRVCLESMNAQVTEAGSAATALATRRRVFDIVFLDLRLGTENGLDLIPHLLGENPTVAIIVVTAHATIETADEAIRRGAWDYLPKPFTPDQIRRLLEKVRSRVICSSPAEVSETCSK
jgi:ActR/RegA family two-component response regulator